MHFLKAHPLLRLSLDIRLNRVQNYAFDRITTGFMHYAVSLFNGQYKSSLLMIDWFSWWNILVSLGFSFCLMRKCLTYCHIYMTLPQSSLIWKSVSKAYIIWSFMATKSFPWNPLKESLCHWDKIYEHKVQLKIGLVQ